MRPVYETPDDRQNERATIMEALRDPSMIVIKQEPNGYDPLSRIDYVLLTKSKRVVAFAEVKNRTCAVDDFDTYMLSQTKWLGLCLCKRLHNIPAYLIVRWTNALGVLSVMHSHMPDFKMTGRTDRNDSADIEICAMLPIKWFKIEPVTNS